jgi:hypothetical protein
MAIGVCRQCLLYMATRTRLRTTACSTTPARVHSTAPRAHTLPVPSRTAPCTPLVLSRISSPLLPCARHALVRRRPAAVRRPSLPLRCIAPVRRPFRVALFPVRRSPAAALHSFLPSASLLRNARMIPRLQVRSNCTIKNSPASRQSLRFYFLSPRHSIRCCRSRSCNS